MIDSKIPQIRSELWNLLIYYLKTRTKNNFRILEDEGGKTFLKLLGEDPQIAKYQWKTSESEENDILRVYIRNFLLRIARFEIPGIKKYTNEISFSESFRNHSELKEFFDCNFKDLEDNVLLSSNFTYTLLIPAFRILFPEGSTIVDLDVNHSIKNIFTEESPYQIKNFKKPPRFWTPFEEEKTFTRDANASFEVLMVISKRSSEEPAYDTFTPYFPLNPVRRNRFIQKIYSIYDFFLLHNPYLEFPPFTFGHKFYLKLPPFSDQISDVPQGLIGYQFHYPTGFLDLKNQAKLDAWKRCWKENYNDFYNIYYNGIDIYGSLRVFHYTLDTLKTRYNIPRTDMKNFLLISTFEGIIFRESIKEKLGLPGKSKPIAQIFINICQEQQKKWQYAKEKFFTDEHLEEFIITAYQYRNNIAHPEKIENIEYKPGFLYDEVQELLKKFNLERNIMEWFSKFLIFILKVWLKKRCVSNDDWYRYLDSLFIIN
ncbi:MAG: hypothetical protein ACFFBC_00350 [Promethearchaeota archaeon]